MGRLKRPTLSFRKLPQILKEGFDCGINCRKERYFENANYHRSVDCPIQLGFVPYPCVIQRTLDTDTATTRKTNVGWHLQSGRSARHAFPLQPLGSLPPRVRLPSEVGPHPRLKRRDGGLLLRKLLSRYETPGDTSHLDLSQRPYPPVRRARCYRGRRVCRLAVIVRVNTRMISRMGARGAGPVLLPVIAEHTLNAIHSPLRRCS